jgi:hypothetical protein
MSEHLPQATLSGRHPAVGDLTEANAVLLMEFGSDPELASNVALLDYIAANGGLQSLPMFVSRSLADTVAARGWNGEIVQVFQGPSAAGVHENTGTFGELSQYASARRVYPGQYDRPALVHNGHNVGTVLRQAGILGFAGDVIVPPGLPHNFDVRSLRHGQPWTAHWLAWVATAHVRDHLLRHRGH